MSRTVMLIPIGVNVGLTSITLGIIHAAEKKGIHINFFKPISQTHNDSEISDQTINIIRNNLNMLIIDPININHVDQLLYSNQKNILMEEIVANYRISSKNTNIILIEGLISTIEHQFIQSLNYEIAKMLNAEVVLVISQGIDTIIQMKKRIELISISSNIKYDINISGVIFNKINAPINKKNYKYTDLLKIFKSTSKDITAKIDLDMLKEYISLPVLGAVPWSFDLIATRAIDIARHLNATIINKGEINTRRIKSLILCSHDISYMLKKFCLGSLLIVSSDRLDILIAICLTAMNGLEIGAVLLTDGYKIDVHVIKICKIAFESGLPIFMVDTDILSTYLNLRNLNLEVPIDDYNRINKVKQHIASYINFNWIESLAVTSGKHSCHYIHPSVFSYRITELARKENKRIVLPEGNEPRIIKAASICAKRGLATCILLGNQDEINHISLSQGIDLDTGIEIIDPEIVRENYVNRLIELRKNKGITEIYAREQLKDNVVLGTLMLEQDEVDGLVSGAVHTTANTIRPPLQLIKTAPGNSLVSSIFFMLLPEKVYVYGDCAININPTAEQLAEIAIQSSNSAEIFGINPYVAMLSYSTGTSGIGSDVEKVRKATLLAQKRRPDLIIDGPLQYDTAVSIDVAKFKAPNSPVAGKATVLIFPDLNTGNITYKAVQRSANLVSIGPMLQGMRKPVNDLSRGALVEDIIYTITLTAIQAIQK